MKKIILVILLALGTVPVVIASLEAKGTVPKRYISLAPSTTEILFALGLDEEVVGVSSYCNYPEKAKKKAVVGEFSRPNIERILSLKPDYVFCTGLKQTPVAEELRRLKIKTYIADPKNIKEILNCIRDIGKITGRVSEAENLIKNMESEIEKIDSKVRLIPVTKRPKVFIEIWHDPLTTAGKGSFIDGLLALAGGINIAYDTKVTYGIFSPEEVIRRNPDCIIITYMGKEKIDKLVGERIGWSGISAVRNNRVYNDINPDYLLRPGPRVVEGLKEIHKRLYP